jgi:hypothetical protein
MSGWPSVQRQRGSRARLVVSSLALVLLAGCGTASPYALQQAMRAGQALFEPLSHGELATVTVSVSQAQAAALEVGGPDQAHYSRVGFTYLGRWVPPLPSLGHAPTPDPIPVYLVQIFADPSSDFPAGASGYVAVDARTGEALVSYGPCWGNDCSVRP